MVQKFYLRDAVTTVAGTLPGATTVQASSPGVTASGASTNRSMTTTPGSVQVASTLATLAQTPAVQHNWFRRFISPPLGSQALGVTPLVQWTFGFAGLTSNASNSAFFFQAALVVWRPSTGAKVFTIFDASVQPTTPNIASEEGGVWNGGNSPFDFTCNNGDVLVLEVWGEVSQAMATSYTWTFDYEGTTDPVNGVAVSSAASYLQSSVDLQLYLPPVPNLVVYQAVKRAAYW